MVWRYIPASGGGHPISLLTYTLFHLELGIFTFMPALRKLRNDLRTVDMAGYMAMASGESRNLRRCAAMGDKWRAVDWVWTKED